MTNYILIDAKTRRPVPLPYETMLGSRIPVRAVNFYTGPSGNLVQCVRGKRTSWARPEQLGLELITEADFMKEQDDG